MTKAELVAKLEGAKELTSVVSIDLVIAALGMLDEPAPVKYSFGKITQSLADKIHSEIEQSLDYNSRDLVDKDTAEFEFGYNGREVELREVEIDLNAIMQHVSGVLETFIEDEDDDAPDSSWTSADGGSPSAHISAE